ncbi:MAG: histidinol-phosphate transaminase, partial [Gammaproteobacteria bacterium]
MSDSRQGAKNWVRPEIQALSAYHVPNPGDMVKLDAMENPYHWPADMVAEWQLLLAGVEVNRYPDPAARQLVERLRHNMAIAADQSVILGNGSDELIQIMAMALAAPGRCVMSVEPSFVMYRMIATFVGMDYHGVPLADDFSIDLDAMLAAIERHQPALVFIAYPNNPTGNLFDEAAIEAIIKATPGLVVVDEAYNAFAQASFMNRLGEFDNLVVMRTVSKLGLAGLRLGLLAGPAEWVDEFNKVRLPYNINVLTQLSTDFALSHEAVLDEQTAAIRADRAVMDEALRAMPGLTVYPSSANFILFRTPEAKATPLFEALKQRGVLVKNLSPVGGA